MPKDNILTIPLPDDFNMEANLGYLNRSENECMHDVLDGVITKCISIGGTPVLVRIHANQDKEIIVQFLQHATDAPTRSAVAAYIREWFDLDTDLAPFYQMASTDALLKKAVDKAHGLRVIGVPDLFEALCWGILGQQINLAFAYTLKRRFVEKYGSPITWENRMYWAFPSFHKIAKLTVDDLRDIKMTARKSEYIIGIAQLMADHTLSKEKLMQMNFKEAEKTLTAIRGIGPWTANYVLMRCLRFTCAFPIDDVGLMRAIQHLRGMKRKPTKAEIMDFSQRWKDWEAYATFYLWRTLY